MDKLPERFQEKILVADDTRFHRTLTSDILARAGYLPVQVENGARALQAIDTQSPDLIILDTMMPDLDGLEVCRRLKADRFTNHIPVLMLTTMGSVADKINSLRTGADAYLAKPFQPEELIAQIEALLRRSFQYDPLTRLPAAPYLHHQIDLRLKQNLPTAIAYADLDYFRAYNQVYGHERGDEVLLQTARLLAACLPPEEGLLGHLGSDDFVALMPAEGAAEFAAAAIEGFEKRRASFYDAPDLARGTILVENRRGECVPFPLLSLSVAEVSSEHRMLTGYVQASELLGEVMRYLKTQGGGKWMSDRRTR